MNVRTSISYQFMQGKNHVVVYVCVYIICQINNKKKQMSVNLCPLSHLELFTNQFINVCTRERKKDVIICFRVTKNEPGPKGLNAVINNE